MSQTGNYSVELKDKWSDYRLAVQQAKDVAVLFGLDSEQYKISIMNMEVEFNIVPKTRLEKLIIWLNKKL